MLVVDDNETCRDIVEGFARSMKMEVLSAASASAALEALDATHASGAPTDVVFLDLHMPDQDGFQLADPRCVGASGIVARECRRDPGPFSLSKSVGVDS